MSRLVEIPHALTFLVDRFLSLLAYAMVLFYRRYISPYKGFRCTTPQ